jgi:hypothetical protein
VQEQEYIRQEALNALATLAREDPGFLVRAFDDLEGTLDRYGFSLNAQEMQVLGEFQDRVRRSEEQIIGLLRNPRLLYAFWRI